MPFPVDTGGAARVGGAVLVMSGLVLVRTPVALVQSAHVGGGVGPGLGPAHPDASHVRSPFGPHDRSVSSLKNCSTAGQTRPPPERPCHSRRTRAVIRKQSSTGTIQCSSSPRTVFTSSAST